jgi:hypothetical protein
MAASRRKQSAAAPQSVIRDFGTQKAPRPKRGILRPLSFGRVGCPDAGLPAPPSAKQARNRDHHSTDPGGQTQNEHNVAEEKRHLAPPSRGSAVTEAGNG